MVLPALVLCAGTTARAQNPTPTPTASATPSLEREFFKNILLDQKAIWTAPFHLNREDAKWMVPAGVGMMALFTTDRITGDEMAESDSPVNASRVISYAGSAYGVAAVAGTFYLVGRGENNTRARETGILTAEAALDSSIVVLALKGITQRGRPHSGEDRSEFFAGGSSFPSGHSAAAWSMATIVANEYHDQPIVQIAAYGVATAVSVARFTGGEHYISDVVAGSAIGFGIGKYVYKTHHRNTDSSGAETDGFTESRWPAIRPEFNRHARAYGIGLTWNF